MVVASWRGTEVVAEELSCQDRRLSNSLLVKGRFLGCRQGSLGIGLVVGYCCLGSSRPRIDRQKCWVGGQGGDWHGYSTTLKNP